MQTGKPSRIIRFDALQVPRIATRWYLLDACMLVALLVISYFLAKEAYPHSRAITISATSTLPQVLQTGFYEPETFSGSDQSFRWTKGDAQLTLPNSGSNLVLNILLAGGTNRSTPVEVHFGSTSARFVVTPTPRIYSIQSLALASDQVILSVHSPTIYERHGDRSIGIVVGNVTVQNGNVFPPMLFMMLAGTTCILYVVARLLINQLWLGASIVILTQFLFYTWLTHTDWPSSATTSTLIAYTAVAILLLASIRIPALIKSPFKQDMTATSKTMYVSKPLILLLYRLRSRTTPAAQFVTIYANAIKASALCICATLAILLLFLRIRTEFTARDFELDASWFLELEYQLQHGHLLGRDSYFTYGPLAQLIMSLGVFLRGGGPVINGFTTGYLMFEITGVILFTLAIASVTQLDWRSAVLLFCTGFLLDGVMNMRQAMVILSMILLIRTIDAPKKQRRRLAMLAGFICFMAQLLTAEVGAYTIVATVALLGGLALLAFLKVHGTKLPLQLHSWRVYTEIMGLCVTIIIVLNILLELTFRLSSPKYEAFDYLRITSAILTNYNYTMGTPWTLALQPSLLLLALITFCIVTITLQVWQAEPARVHLLIGLGIAAMLNMKSALVRSDVGHIIMASGPLIFLFVVLLCLSDWKSVTRYIGIGLLGCTLAYWPNIQLSTVRQIINLANGSLSVRAKWHAVRSIDVSPTIIAPIDLQQAVDKQKQIVSFPYDNVIAMALGQESLAPVLQTYSAHSLQLQDKYIRDIERQRDNVEVIYGIDGVSVGGIDGVQNITRVPRIFQYLVENFELKVDHIFRKGYVVLQARKQPQRLHFTTLTYRPISDPNGQTILLTQPAHCELIEAEITMHYPAIALLGRPRGVKAEVRNGAATIATSEIVAVDHDKSFRTFLYLGKSDAFYKLFDPRLGSDRQTQFDSIQIMAPTQSIFDVAAQDVAITDLRCVSTR